MGRIIVSENVSLDGVVEDPTGEEGFERGGWYLPMADGERAAWATHLEAEARDVEALLLGRRTDAWFARRWLSREGTWADRLNGMPKYVVSGTLHGARWRNATLLTGDPVAEVAAVKQRVAGDLVVYGSTRLVHTLLDHDLVDELRLIVFPVLVGAGERIFGQTSGRKPLRLVESRLLGDRLVLLTYRLEA
jgi:dihydrofolate reductase